MFLYFGLPKIPMTLKHHVNPLDRWRENSSLLPHLAKKVRRLFCVPATFVPYERVFSMAGNIVQVSLRNKLNSFEYKLIDY